MSGHPSLTETFPNHHFVMAMIISLSQYPSLWLTMKESSAHNSLVVNASSMINGMMFVSSFTRCVPCAASRSFSFGTRAVLSPSNPRMSSTSSLTSSWSFPVKMSSGICLSELLAFKRACNTGMKSSSSILECRSRISFHSLKSCEMSSPCSHCIRMFEAVKSIEGLFFLLLFSIITPLRFNSYCFWLCTFTFFFLSPLQFVLSLVVTRGTAEDFFFLI
mmetsp:Transcript_5271/g.15334  ORF Transcript_5271/g.15334 Transcript_5271/m.15334 type:complete len:219 (+) Transcript_5271:780-1436(+)